MGQTAKSTAALLTSLADNTAGSISPEDVRDIVASGFSYGALVGAQSTATVTLTADWVALTHWTILGPASSDITLDAVTSSITVGAAGWYVVGVTSTFTLGGGATGNIAQNEEYFLVVDDASHGNSVGISSRSAKNKSATTATAGFGDSGMFGITYLAAGTVLSVWAKKNTGATAQVTGTIRDGQFFVARIA